MQAKVLLYKLKKRQESDETSNIYLYMEDGRLKVQRSSLLS